MRILVTGASGFIGSYLVDSLSKDSHLSIKAISRYPILNLNANVKNYNIDLSQQGFDKHLPTKVDIVVHLAQSLHYRNFPDGVEDIFAVNVQATQTLLEWSRRVGVKKFIFASTGNVYKRQNKRLTENDVCEPFGYYGASKYAAENLIRSYNNLFETIILRFFGVYGIGQKSMIVPNIINKVLTGGEIELANGEGLNFTPLYISDCIEMLRIIIFRETPHVIYNLSGNEAVNLGQILRLIIETLKSNPDFITNALNIKLTQNEVNYLMGDSSLFNRFFNFSPLVNIEEGILKTLKSDLP